LGNDSIFKRVKEMIRTHGRLRQDGLMVGDVVTGPGLTGPATIRSIGTDGMIFVYDDGRVAGINAAEKAEFMPYYVLVQPKTPMIPIPPIAPVIPAIPPPAIEAPFSGMPAELPINEPAPSPVITKTTSGFKLSLPLIAIVLLVAFVMFKKK
jgi:hypothetical protein